jgi:hypothetical protein
MNIIQKWQHTHAGSQQSVDQTMKSVKDSIASCILYSAVHLYLIAGQSFLQLTLTLSSTLKITGATSVSIDTLQTMVCRYILVCHLPAIPKVGRGGAALLQRILNGSVLTPILAHTLPSLQLYMRVLISCERFLP